MDWMTSALKYAPDLFVAGEAAGQAISSWVNGDQSNEAAADIIKPFVMLGARVIAENNCQTAVGAGATTAASSATYDLAVSTMTGKDYGLVKDVNAGDYTRAAEKSVRDFGIGAVSHASKSKPFGKRRRGKKKTQPTFASIEVDSDCMMDRPEIVEECLRGIAEAFPQKQTIVKDDQWRFA